jgi:hypothetical protein
MATRQKKTPSKQPLKVQTIKITPAEEEILRHLGQEASDRLGWTISNSTIVRALIQYAGHQPPAWLALALFPPIEQEIAAGRVWGYIKKPH